MADPGFPVGGRGLPRRLRFIKFVCQNERIGSLRGGAHAGCAPLNPPMTHTDTHTNRHTDMTKTLPLPHVREVIKGFDRLVWSGSFEKSVRPND